MTENLIQYLVLFSIGFGGIFLGRRMAIKRAIKKKLKNKNVN